MTKLDEIENRYLTMGDIEIVQIAFDLGLLVRAVRQQSAVIRAAMHAFDTDDWSMWSAMSAQLDSDVLELIADDRQGRLEE